MSDSIGIRMANIIEKCYKGQYISSLVYICNWFTFIKRNDRFPVNVKVDFPFHFDRLDP